MLQKLQHATLTTHQPMEIMPASKIGSMTVMEAAVPDNMESYLLLLNSVDATISQVLLQAALLQKARILDKLRQSESAAMGCLFWKSRRSRRQEITQGYRHDNRPHYAQSDFSKEEPYYGASKEDPYYGAPSLYSRNTDLSYGSGRSTLLDEPLGPLLGRNERPKKMSVRKFNLHVECAGCKFSRSKCHNILDLRPCVAEQEYRMLVEEENSTKGDIYMQLDLCASSYIGPDEFKRLQKLFAGAERWNSKPRTKNGVDLDHIMLALLQKRPAYEFNRDGRCERIMLARVYPFKWRHDWKFKYGFTKINPERELNDKSIVPVEVVIRDEEGLRNYHSKPSF
ncbi:hypothetical protein B0T26DRAFT_3271 [Lasiosphaeria miniovina]|uniref:Uncharacterized protein n=1 Tax=Lasiosphaeria miniovina TaxID=1954250 RepID=A0AA40E969_9PEZI|nr:uncharacterized protein B0T26DRAFT_3271 [Lasiosphaeria miniovina]KAK0732994.1 hypothetical protein B0T26DRAFT_3271 [Lasiosphaeria miniovina]